MFSKNKKTSSSNKTVETLNAKQLAQVLGGSGGNSTPTPTPAEAQGTIKIVIQQGA